MLRRSYGFCIIAYKHRANANHSYNKRKIDMADEIFVINVGGYIGESTRSEIEYAKKAGKAIRYLHP